MMRAMLGELCEAGYPRCSLSVQKENPALRLYERMGFRIVGEGADDSEWLMVADLALDRICPRHNSAHGLECREELADEEGRHDA